MPLRNPISSEIVFIETAPVCDSIRAGDVSSVPKMGEGGLGLIKISTEIRRKYFLNPPQIQTDPKSDDKSVRWVNLHN